MRISRHDLRHRYSNSLVIDAGSDFTLRACSQAKWNGMEWGMRKPGIVKAGICKTRNCKSRNL